MVLLNSNSEVLNEAVVIVVVSSAPNSPPVKITVPKLSVRV